MTGPGPIALIGGGEHMPSTAEIDRRVLELSGSSNPKVAVLPQAAARRQLGKTAALARNQWVRLGAKVSIVDPSTGLDRALGELANADIAAIPGGHPNKLIQRLGASPLADLLVARWLEGMAVSGSSAGAMAAFEWRINLYPPNPLRPIPGLGLVDGFVAAPHFDRFRAARWAHRVMPSLGGLRVLGLDEATALVGYNNRFEVLGPGLVTVVTPEGASAFGGRDLVRIDLLTRRNSLLESLQPRLAKDRIMPASHLEGALSA